MKMTIFALALVFGGVTAHAKDAAIPAKCLTDINKSIKAYMIQHSLTGKQTRGGEIEIDSQNGSNLKVSFFYNVSGRDSVTRFWTSEVLEEDGSCTVTNVTE